MIPNFKTDRIPGRGKYLRLIIGSGDWFIVNLVWWLTTLVFPALAQAHALKLWLMVNLAFVPMALMLGGKVHTYIAIRMDSVVRSSLLAVGAHALTFMSLVTMLSMVGLARKVFIFYYICLLMAVLVFRTVATYTIKEYRRRGYNFTRVVIVGTGQTAMNLYENMKEDSGFGYHIQAFFSPDKGGKSVKGIPVLPLDQLDQFMNGSNIRQIFYTLQGQPEALSETVRCADTHMAEFYLVPEIPRIFNRRMELQSIRSLQVLSMSRNPLKRIVNRVLKRGFDIGFSSLVLCFYPLVYIPVAIAIKMGSPGPVYFKQERTGHLGKSFMCYKFRTMRQNKDANSCQATQNDPRKTRLGDFLRRTSLDELPQFINVWRGDMSVVGPRPHMLKHTEEYTRLVDRYMARHAVKPGITGWAQVNGYRGITDELWKMERRVEHDVWYIENWSFLLDLKIIVRTVINAVRGESNAF